MTFSLQSERITTWPEVANCFGVETMKEAPVSRVTWNSVAAIPRYIDFRRHTMFYVGLDIHDKRIAICVLSEAGQVARRARSAPSTR